MSKNWREGLERWPRALPTFDFDPKTTALLIVDMQNFCSRPTGSLGQVLKEKYPEMYSYFSQRAELILKNNIRLLHFFRENNMRVVFTTIGPALKDGSDYFSPRREADRIQQERTGIITNHPIGSPEHAIVEELTPNEKELVINKTSMGAFNTSNIDITLRKMKIETLVVTGVCSNACLYTTALDAADRYYKVVLAEDACGGFDEDSHIAVMRNFARLCGMVWSTDEVIRYLSEKM